MDKAPFTHFHFFECWDKQFDQTSVPSFAAAVIL